jgi:hypothetical protein
MDDFDTWFYDDCEFLFPYGCVRDVINEFKDVSTPEELLTKLMDRRNR